ncbi:peptide-methionine (S)-S-oxide reductase [Stenotrophomonas sp. Betaine-02u-21]|uniref:peptide-methionine (S)-S-oxide reductase MsrA n=1 Tax=unclassified Stenotrophomonas TaxID=196198 RepID=UPI000C31DC32|nr:MULTISPECIES: peptide-methionine (S)-S-oxide reductase MsrA [unclassified Stenotrophomonas]PKH70696.1 peptide-methionine (S)-S-oxide reductase [Stenotrophomonas sp. Betaine-02u-23]PKH74966.1 peptide-methionine (S)-S-oxide reductase [Stenotrophomonas sp. Betaine-02u-21]PKH95437.1 peptide-methionine (S)-S-oxide reductase [Stenotrophomonas sp. Bg11-02]
MKLSLEQGIAAAVAALVVGALVVFAVDAGPANGAGMGPARAAEESRALPAPAGAAAFKDERTQASVVFAGGCFWGVQGVFQHVKGVGNAVSGYIGGDASTARYETISSGRTGHAEAVRVDYDPRQVSYGQLLQLFFSVAHDPTQLNRQGPDHGTQYRSAIFSDDARQQAANRAYVGQIGTSFSSPVVTELGSGKRFFPAEAYHQNYLERKPQAAYIRYYDAPKLVALQQRFPQLYRRDPVLVPMK